MAHSDYAPYWVQLHYVLRALIADLCKRKFATFLTVLVISMSLTIPVASYLLWKNVHLAGQQFTNDNDITVYLHKNLTDRDAELVVDRIRQVTGVAEVKYISRQESLTEFRTWSGLNDELDLLEDNPLPAVVIITPSREFTDSNKRQQLHESLSQVKGVEDIRLDTVWLDKLNALNRLVAHIAIVGAVLMVLAVFLVIGNSVRADVYSAKPNIEIMKLLGATEQFVLRPFLWTGIIYGVLGALAAMLLGYLLVGYFASAVKFVTDLFMVNFHLSRLEIGEMLFLTVFCAVVGYISAWLSATRYIRQLDKKQ